MSDYIEIPVRVPADLVVRKDDAEGWSTIHDGRNWLHYSDRGPTWVCNLGRQIAAAIEARKPKPPKFQVGDVVEWEDGGEFFAGRITAERDGDGDYRINDGHWVAECCLTLVRRAAK